MAEIFLILGITLIAVNFMFLFSGHTMCVVQIGKSELRGLRKVTENGVKYCAFLGVPYALKPKRFHASKLKYFNWSGSRDFVYEPKKCVQISKKNHIIGKEDCLYVNIYKPLSPTFNQKLCATLAWFHGGSFNFGSLKSDLHYPDAFIEKKIIVVTMNYRLGSLGFFSQPNMKVEPNLGLKDQQTALNWIQKYIHYFGGDPLNVTIGGWSAGSASVTYHLYSNSSNGLFSKAIAMGGTFLNPWAFNLNSNNCSSALCRKLNINCNYREEMYKLLDRPVENIIPFYTSDYIYKYFGLDYSCFVPTLENDHINADGNTAFIRATPEELIFQKPSSDVPILLGYTSLEGSCEKKTHLQNFLNKNFEFNYKNDEANNFMNNLTESLTLIGNFKNILELHRIADMIYGVISFADGYSDRAISDIFMYRFDLSDYRKLRRICAVYEKGAVHGDDVKFLFQKSAVLNGDNSLGSSKAIIKVKAKLINYFANFIKYGNPNSKISNHHIPEWPVYTNHSKQMMNINRNLLIHEYRPKKIFRIWETVYSCLYRNHCVNYTKKHEVVL